MEQFLVTTLLSLPAIGAYAINAIGIVVVYRASKVLNLAHGGIAMLAAFGAFQFVEWGIPRPAALVAGVLLSIALALVVERVFVRRLRSGGSTAQTIGTVAAFGVMVAAAGRFWGTTPRLSIPVFPEKGFEVANTVITVGQIGLFLSMAVIAVLLFFLLQRTYLGLVLRGTAENRTAASLMGADPDRMTMLAWGIGGAMAGIAGQMLAAVGSLHPYNLALAPLPAYVAALIGGMHSLPGAVGGAAVVGLLEGWIPLLGPLEGLSGNSQLAIAIVALVVMASRGARFGSADQETASLEDSAGRALLSNTSRRWLLGLGAVLAILPHTDVISFSLLGNLNTAGVYAIIAVSLVILTGWVGQISLAHATFVGIGAFITGILTNSWSIEFPLNLPIAAGVAGVAALVLGVVALRVRGLYLAVATMIFAWVGDQFLFRQDWLTSQDVIFPEPIGRAAGAFPSIDLTSRTTFFYVVWAAALLVVFAAANLRDTKVGRAFFAVRGSETAAASLGIDVTRYKLMAFVMSGAVAGLAGNLLMVQERGVLPDQFGITESLFFLAILVVGGVQSLGGAVAAALVFGGINELFFQVGALAEYVELTSALLLALVLLAYRRGLAGMPAGVASVARRVRPALEPLSPVGRAVSTAGRRAQTALAVPARRIADVASSLGEAAGAALRSLLRRGAGDGEEGGRAEDAATPAVVKVADATAANGAKGQKLPADRTKREPLLEAEEITVRFGGLTAADHVNVFVYEGEIVGLIGPNGAGKTTTFNAIAGLNEPTEGHVRLFGRDVTSMPVHQRAALGVGRTFQLIQLFPQLSVFDNLLVATHLKNPSNVFSGMIAGTSSLLAEAEARQRVRDVIEILDLSDVADRQVAGLPFGMLRMVEVGRAMVTDPKLIMLDEPASGLDNAETDRLAELLLSVRSLGVGLLLIEHDVRMVTSVSDYMYVINQGAPLADGTPADVQRNPDVIAAYLGTSGDETAEVPVGGAGAPVDSARRAPSGEPVAKGDGEPSKQPAQKAPAKKQPAKKAQSKKAQSKKPAKKPAKTTKAPS